MIWKTAGSAGAGKNPNWKSTKSYGKVLDEVWKYSSHIRGNSEQIPRPSAANETWNRMIFGGNTTETNLGPAASQPPSRTNNFRGGEDCMTNSIRDEPEGERGCQNR